MISPINRIRHFLSTPLTIKITRFLHIRSFLKFIYLHAHQLTFIKKRKRCYTFEKIRACFDINTPIEVVIVEDLLLYYKSGGERQILKIILEHLQPGDIAFDVGANLGVYTTFMGKKVGINGCIVAFEPEVNNFDRLKTNIELNNIKNNTILLPVALGDKFQLGMLHGTKVWSHLIKLQDRTLGQIVKIVPGDFMVKTKNLPLPKVVKIDVEGYEYYVIRGLQETLANKTCQMVCCEVHETMLPPKINSQMVLQLLKSFGFRRIKIFTRSEIFHAICFKE